MMMIRVDAPDRVRKRAAKMSNGGYGMLAVMALFMIVTGLISTVILAAGRDLIGVAVCAVWIAAWGDIAGRARRIGREVNRWLVAAHDTHHRLRIREAHEAYWNLSAEARAQYGLPIVQTMYRLAAIEVRGRDASNQIHEALWDRVEAIRGLVDAEDKLRLYGADPMLADRDDIAAAEEWSKAVADVERVLREPLPQAPTRRPPPRPMDPG